MINRKKIIAVILSICLSYIIFIQVQYIYDKNKEFSPTKCFSKELAEFMIAAERGKIRKMRSLYKKGNININDIGKCDITPLIWMLRWIIHTTDEPLINKQVSCINKQVVKELLKLGADPNFVTSYGESPVYRAAEMPTPILKIILDNGGNPNLINPKTQETALYPAIHDLDNLKLLISYGADINFKVTNGESLLMHSITSRQYEVAVYLLNNGLDIIPAEIPEVIKYIKFDKKLLGKEFLYHIEDIKAALLKRGINIDE